MSKKIYLVPLSLLVLLLVTVGTIVSIQHNESKQTIYSYTTLKKTNKAIVFYKDDCNDCKKVYPKLYLHDLIHHDIIFVNMNADGNRNLIKKFSLIEVPTFINGNQKYSGTNFHDINKILNTRSERN